MAEALSSGLLIVAADTPINREICGNAALYFAPFRPSALVDCLKRLDAEPALRDRLRTEAKRTSEQFYRWDDHVDRLIETFGSLARGK
jgi:glycosyltransferase involved in cell wall biosynthesis